MHNRCIDENNLTFLQKVGGQGRIKRKFLYYFIEKKKNLRFAESSQLYVGQDGRADIKQLHMQKASGQVLVQPCHTAHVPAHLRGSPG